MLKVQTPTDETELRAEQRIPMSYEEFLALDGEHQHAEWEEGVTIIFMPATPRHQDIVTFLAALIRLFSEFFQLGRVYTAPVEMKVSPTSNAREPDLLFVTKEHLGWIDEKRLTGPADLAVEVISPESASRDQKKKLREYEAAGVKEYWVLDARPGRQVAQFWQLNAHGRYQAEAINEDGIYHSLVLKGFWLDVAWFSAAELPDPLFTFAQIVGLPQDMVERLRQIAARGPVEE
ncbi:MAG: Uma2 family endonuclease [Caldilineaceae bacterium]